MWVFTSFGVLMPSVRPAHTIPVGDNRLIQVRTRRRKDLEILRREYLPDLGEIIEIPYSDYEYRAYCTHEQWAAALGKISMDIDYTKFKPTTESKYHDKQLHSLYNRVWGVFFDMVSTTRHKQRYLSGPSRKSDKRPAHSHYERGQAPIYQNLADFEYEQQSLDDLIPADWESEVPVVTRRPDGRIDHSYCEHGQSAAAKKRCARRNRNT